MAKIAKRMMDVEESPTLAITAKASELKAKGADVLSFAAGEPDFDTPENIKKAAIDAIGKGRTKYTPVGGIPELKDAVIGKFRRDNSVEYKREEILVSCGGKHSFFNFCLAFLDPGDEVIVPSPYWVSYPPMIKLGQGVPVIVPTKEQNGFKMQPDEFKAAITKNTKAVVINSPSNPTGSVYTKAELGEILDIALSKGIFVLSDEIYEKLSFDAEPFSIVSLDKRAKDNVMVFNGVSKTYSMTGWRIGYAAGPKEIIAAMAKIQSQSTSNPTSLAQWAAVEALNGPQDDVVKMIAAFKKRRDLITDGLNGISGISIVKPGGAFYAFANVSKLFGKKAGDRKINGSFDLATYLLEDSLVALVPGVAFGDDNCVRLSYACSEDNIKKGLKRIEEAVAKLK
ncbi:MAG: pyridoxal phosphate-dependent aminotransferase [Deltaproteobacteria bacterium]|nr:pyridoxal phosphate-dependent aminotransferase [Deltaproteobacteria bacterium]